MPHVLLDEEAAPCIRAGLLASAALVSLIGSYTVAQVLGAGIPTPHEAPAQSLDDERPAVEPIVPENMTAIETATVEEVQHVTTGFKHGLTPEVMEFADGLYIGVAIWEMSLNRPMEDWEIVFVNNAASPMLQKNMRACVGLPVFACFPELNNEAGRRYGELARVSLATRRTIHVGATQFAQRNGVSATYYNAIQYVDDHHVAVLYHVLDTGPTDPRGTFELGLTLSEERAIDVQLQALATVVEELDHKLDEEAYRAGH